jgi:hypothetical protein
MIPAHLVVVVKFALSVDECEPWIKQAYSLGWKREEPKRAWKNRERKEAIRFAIYQTAIKAMEDK